jgi:ELWxxDGT repeat protein
VTRLTALTVAALCCAAAVRAQSPYLVKDINPSADLSVDSAPRQLRAGDEIVYFVAQAGAASRGFWKTAGTPASTTLIMDALSGAQPNVATIGDIGYFAFSDMEHGIELWRTDGTTAGTGLVHDIVPGTAHSAPTQVTAAGSLVYFAAYEGVGVGLWRSDGSADGTIPLSSGPAESFIAAGDILYFIRSLPGTGQELWRSDGTAAGTHILEDTCPGSCSSLPKLFTPVGNRLFYVAYSPAFGDEVRVTDGTTTQVVADLVPGGLGPGVESLAPLGSSLVFSTSSSGIWRTDGTPVGTETISSLRGRDLTSAAGNVFFQATTPGFGSELWQTDGTAVGTGMVGDLCPGACGFFDTPVATRFVGAPQLLYFIRYDGATSDLWRSDGTLAGTFIVKGSAVAVTEPVVLGNTFVFVAEPPATGRELWATDGTTTGTVQLTEAVANSSGITQPTIVESRMFFQAFEPASGRDLWVTEGTDATTRPLDVAAETGHALPQWPTALGDRLLTDIRFALPPSSANGLWISDGSPEGTTRLGPQMNATTPWADGSDALFLGSATSFDPDLWKTDGTPEGTVRLKDLSPDGFTTEGHFLPALGGTRLVAVDGSSPGLWRSDGTAEGTIPLASVFPTEGVLLGGGLILNVGGELWRTDGWPQGTSLLSPAPQVVGRLTAAGGGRAFFVAHSAAAGRELWATDGTEAGTSMVKDINPGASDAFPIPLYGADEPRFVELNGLVYFVAADDVHGDELWRSDGTEAGTVLVDETVPGLDSANIGALTAAGGRLYFQGYSLTEGRELWTSDGTTVTLSADIAPGPYSSTPDQLRSDGRRLYFVADDGVHGAEPWALDLPLALSVDDVAIAEGDGPSGVASFTVRLSSPTTTTATVGFATADGSANAGTDYLPVSGTLTFAPGSPQTLQVEVPLVGDLGDEPAETFELRLSSPTGVDVADGQAVALVQDDDMPQISLAGTSILEGDAGTTRGSVGVALVTKDGAPTTLAKTVAFATEPGTAEAGDDFLSVSGTLTFPPGTASGAPTPVLVTVVGDGAGEDDETFALRVTSTSALQPLSLTTPIVIQDDDGGIPEPAVELMHGSAFRHSFDIASSRSYRLLQEPHSSYELRLDETSGDVQPVELHRIGGDGMLVQVGEPDGTGGSVAMRWANATSSAVGDQTISVASAACAVECGPEDTYRLRAWDTTLRAPRFNNIGVQRTVLLLQNRSAAALRAHVVYWRDEGVVAGIATVDIGPHEAHVVDTVQQVPDLSGSVTVSHDAGYGELVGKLVTLETDTGFSFDTPLLPRIR